MKAIITKEQDRVRGIPRPIYITATFDRLVKSCISRTSTLSSILQEYTRNSRESISVLGVLLLISKHMFHQGENFLLLKVALWMFAEKMYLHDTDSKQDEEQDLIESNRETLDVIDPNWKNELVTSFLYLVDRKIKKENEANQARQIIKTTKEEKKNEARQEGTLPDANIFNMSLVAQKPAAPHYDDTAPINKLHEILADEKTRVIFLFAIHEALPDLDIDCYNCEILYKNTREPFCMKIMKPYIIDSGLVTATDFENKVALYGFMRVIMPFVFYEESYRGDSLLEKIEPKQLSDDDDSGSNYSSNDEAQDEILNTKDDEKEYETDDPGESYSGQAVLVAAKKAREAAQASLAAAVELEKLAETTIESVKSTPALVTAAIKATKAAEASVEAATQAADNVSTNHEVDNLNLPSFHNETQKLHLKY